MITIDYDKLTIINGKWFLDGQPYTGIGKTYGATFYYKDGLLHRDNGLPAIEWADGTKAWLVNGKRIYSWDEYQKATNCSKEELVMYKLTHGNISWYHMR